MDLPKRKNPRLEGFDYATQRAYFVTICIKNHRNLFGSISPEHGHILSPLGQCAAANLAAIPSHFPEISIHHAVVMPNHVHMLLLLGCTGQEAVRKLSLAMQAYKASVSRWYGQSIWQRSFHDHIIRNDCDYREIWNYIECNPLKWQLDRFYSAY